MRDQNAGAGSSKGPQQQNATLSSSSAPPKLQGGKAEDQEKSGMQKTGSGSVTKCPLKKTPHKNVTEK